MLAVVGREYAQCGLFPASTSTLSFSIHYIYIISTPVIMQSVLIIQIYLCSVL